MKIKPEGSVTIGVNNPLSTTNEPADFGLMLVIFAINCWYGLSFSQTKNNLIFPNTHLETNKPWEGEV